MHEDDIMIKLTLINGEPVYIKKSNIEAVYKSAENIYHVQTISSRYSVRESIQDIMKAMRI